MKNILKYYAIYSEVKAQGLGLAATVPEYSCLSIRVVGQIQATHHPAENKTPKSEMTPEA